MLVTHEIGAKPTLKKENIVVKYKVSLGLSYFQRISKRRRDMVEQQRLYRRRTILGKAFNMGFTELNPWPLIVTLNGYSKEG